MAIADADEKLEKEQTAAGRLAEVRAADRRRALAEQLSQNEERNRAPDLYNDKSAELLEQEYGQPTGTPATGREEPSEAGEEEEELGGQGGPQGTDSSAVRNQMMMAEQRRAGQMVALQRAAAQKRQVLIKQSEKRSGELTNKIKIGQGKIDAEKKNKILGCLLWFIPVLGWFAKIFQRIITAKSRVEAIKAKAEVPVLQRKLDAEKRKLQSDLKKQQQQMVRQMQQKK